MLRNLETHKEIKAPVNVNRIRRYYDARDYKSKDYQPDNITDRYSTIHSSSVNKTSTPFDSHTTPVHSSTDDRNSTTQVNCGNNHGNSRTQITDTKTSHSQANRNVSNDVNTSDRIVVN